VNMPKRIVAQTHPYFYYVKSVCWQKETFVNRYSNASFEMEQNLSGPVGLRPSHTLTSPNWLSFIKRSCDIFCVVASQKKRLVCYHLIRNSKPIFPNIQLTFTHFETGCSHQCAK
jgi:hypothetical protein